METPENKPVFSAPLSTSQPTPARLEDQIDSLRHLVTSVLVLVIITSGAFNIYLWRQVKYLRQDVTAYRPQAVAVVSEFERTAQPQMRDFIVKVQDFSKAHPSDPAFNAIMAKFRLTNALPPITRAPTSATTGAPAKK